MAEFTVTVSDPEDGHTYQIEIDGHTLALTGGSDKAGRPMRPDVRGVATKSIMSDGGVGFEPTADGERKRITVRGREVGDETRQINAKIVEYGSGAVADLLGDDE